MAQRRAGGLGETSRGWLGAASGPTPKVSPEERRKALRTLALMLAAFVFLVGGGSGFTWGITRSLVATIGVAIGAFVLWAFGATAIALTVESRRKHS
jgi:hypothetical protein